MGSCFLLSACLLMQLQSSVLSVRPQYRGAVQSAETAALIQSGGQGQIDGARRLVEHAAIAYVDEAGLKLPLAVGIQALRFARGDQISTAEGNIPWFGGTTIKLGAGLSGGNLEIKYHF